jgi:hypothetical protein
VKPSSSIAFRLVIATLTLCAPSGLLEAQETIARCPSTDEDTSGLVGVVRDADGRFVLAGATIVARWVDAEGARTSAAVDTDEAGIYRLCDLPTDEGIQLRASYAGYFTDEVRVRIEPGPPAGYDFTLSLRGQPAYTDSTLSTIPGRVVGRILDRETGRTVVNADVILEGVDEHRATNANGQFAFPDVPPGIYSVRVHHLAYDEIAHLVSVVANRTSEVNFELSADPISLEPIVVTALREQRLENNGFYDRRETAEKLGLGMFFSPEEIRRTGGQKATQLLARVPGVRVICQGGRNCTIRMTRGNPSLSSRSEQGCDNTNVYIDGIRVIRDTSPNIDSIDDFVIASEIAAMEVYRHAGEMPAEFGGSVGRCGAIVIWTGTQPIR